MTRYFLLFVLITLVVAFGYFFLRIGKPKPIPTKTTPEVTIIASSDALNILGSLTKEADQNERGKWEASPSSVSQNEALGSYPLITKEIEKLAKETTADVVEGLKRSFPNLTEISQSKLTEKLSAEVFQSLLTKFSSANEVVSSGIYQACQEILRKKE